MLSRYGHPVATVGPLTMRKVVNLLLSVGIPDVNGTFAFVYPGGGRSFPGWMMSEFLSCLANIFIEFATETPQPALPPAHLQVSPPLFRGDWSTFFNEYGVLKLEAIESRKLRDIIGKHERITARREPFAKETSLLTIISDERWGDRCAHFFPLFVRLFVCQPVSPSGAPLVPPLDEAVDSDAIIEVQEIFFAILLWNYTYVPSRGRNLLGHHVFLSGMFWFLAQSPGCAPYFSSSLRELIVRSFPEFQMERYVALPKNPTENGITKSSVEQAVRHVLMYCFNLCSEGRVWEDENKGDLSLPTDCSNVRISKKCISNFAKQNLQDFQNGTLAFFPFSWPESPQQFELILRIFDSVLDKRSLCSLLIFSEKYGWNFLTFCIGGRHFRHRELELPPHVLFYREQFLSHLVLRINSAEDNGLYDESSLRAHFMRPLDRMEELGLVKVTRLPAPLSSMFLGSNFFGKTMVIRALPKVL
ncbi:MAG: hypothetical protein LBB14_02565 [Puniceicoccales bacterium]|jgi:hypothetical protein|nr:hypothetical protein [Puniceicoccales bacterium]